MDPVFTFALVLAPCNLGWAAAVLTAGRYLWRQSPAIGALLGLGIALLGLVPATVPIGASGLKTAWAVGLAVAIPYATLLAGLVVTQVRGVQRRPVAEQRSTGATGVQSVAIGLAMLLVGYLAWSNSGGRAIFQVLASIIAIAGAVMCFLALRYMMAHRLLRPPGGPSSGGR
jgi:hypothetical protein